MDNFTFIHSDTYILLSKVHSLVPGIAKVVSISQSPEGEKPKIYFIDNPSAKSVIEELTPEEKAIETINNICKEKHTYFWYSIEDTPFNIEKRNIKQLDVFTELEKNVLMISIPNDNHKTNNLLFFYFKENISNFTITPSKKSLNQENKLIIGSLLYNSILTIMEIIKNDKKVMTEFNRNVNNVIESMKSAQATIDSFREQHDNVMLNYANEVIQELASMYGNMNFEFSKKATKKIKEYNGEIAGLKDAIKYAMFFASSLNIGKPVRDILIDDFHLNFIESEKPRQKETIQPATRQTKTIFLLDKLEEAANTVYKQNKPLTGTNIGNAFYKPISAPAISDALKNHRTTIKNLIIEYPDRWNLIKNEFKPLINILTTNLREDGRFMKQA